MSDHNTTRKILAAIAREVGELDRTIAMTKAARDATRLPGARGDIHARLLDEISRRDGFYRALRTAANVVEVDADTLAEIAAEVGAQKLANELQMEGEVTNA